MMLFLLRHFPSIATLVDRFCVEEIKHSHEHFGTLLYTYIHAMEYTGKHKDPPPVFIVPHWYMCHWNEKVLKTPGELFGLHIYHKERKISNIFVSSEVDLGSTYGSSIVLHEFVHSLQYIDGVPKMSELEIEQEARELQARFLRDHDFPEEIINDVLHMPEKVYRPEVRLR